MIVFLLLVAKNSYAQEGVEQYCYVGSDGTFTWVPMIHFIGKENWYTEARYNYEEMNTGSLYTGKMFLNEGKKLSYSVTPMVGVVIGKFKGGSAGLNLTLDYNDFFFSSQSQYTFSVKDKEANFLFSWVEAGYQPRPWIYVGLSIQHTYYGQLNTGLFEQGVVVGLSIGKLTFPFYGFNPLSDSRYFVLGINMDIVNKDMN